MMDPKASAKAKRSYSQQGRRNHPSPAAIAQKKKATGVGLERKVQRAHSRGLPSNFDRYDDVDDQAESSSGTKLEEGEIAPKSKGADYAYLIEQARSQQLELRAPTVPESASFFDELTTDFMKGVSSIHTVRRKNLLSRCEDDNFVVDDDLTSSFEIPFLNLDFHAIAAQLSKLKLSERLFIEEDLLPEDLRSDDSKGSSSSVQSEKNEAIEMGLNLAAPDSYLYSFPNPKVSQAYPAQGNDQQTAVGENLGQQNGKREAEESPANISEISPLKIGEAEAELDMLLESFKETSLSGSIQGDNKPASRIPFDESLPFDWKSASQNPSYVIRKPPADAELDTLLDSSKENNLSGAIHGGRLDHSSNSRVPDSDFLYTMHQQSSDRIQFSSKNVATASIDDSIDDLLAETSSVLQKRKHTRALALAPELGSMPSTANLSHPHSGSSSIDDLLGVASSNPGSGVQMDDFDSWMDSF